LVSSTTWMSPIDSVGDHHGSWRPSLVHPMLFLKDPWSIPSGYLT
jgi:hypothetical protein